MGKPIGIIQSQWFLILGLPVLFSIIGVFAKRLGKRDGDDSPQLNDWAVSTTVLLMTFSKVSSDLENPTIKIIDSLIWMVGILFMIFFSIDHDRYRSWVKNADGQMGNKKRLFMGVILPDLVSILIFILYQVGKVNP